MTDRPSPHELLGVEPDASPQELRRAFHALARVYHPDRAGGDPAAEARFKEISDAYDAILHPRPVRVPRPAPPVNGAGIWVAPARPARRPLSVRARRRLAAVGAVLALFGAAVGYIVGRGLALDLAAARVAGARAGLAEGQKAGARAAVPRSFARGRKAGYRARYDAAHAQGAVAARARARAIARAERAAAARARAIASSGFTGSEAP